MQDTTINPRTTVVMTAGSVAYSLDEAAVEIDKLIELLQAAKEEGATHVVQASGNYRGAQWQCTDIESYGWVDEG